jgi:hypothetical protein
MMIVTRGRRETHLGMGTNKLDGVVSSQRHQVMLDRVVAFAMGVLAVVVIATIGRSAGRLGATVKPASVAVAAQPADVECFVAFGDDSCS